MLQRMSAGSLLHVWVNILILIISVVGRLINLNAEMIEEMYLLKHDLLFIKAL